jgi:hypothetical protein
VVQSFWMASTLAVKGWIPFLDIQYLRYSKPSLAKKDLLALTFSPASFGVANTFSSFASGLQMNLWLLTNRSFV